ncbi:MAG: hypothetical protein HKN11_16875 [Rhizobiales bacterium]|nr:hypothetical protein [Hyphomicrobiales bacterium]
MRSFTSILAFLALISMPAQADTLRLGAKSIKNLFPGHYEARVRGYKVLFSAHRGGKLVGQAFGRQDRGKWFVKGSRLCVAWRKWTKGKVKCGSVSKRGMWYVASDAKGQVLSFRSVSVVALKE